MFVVYTSIAQLEDLSEFMAGHDKWIFHQMLIDPVTCHMLQAAQLRKLMFTFPASMKDAMPLIRLIIKGLPQLKIIEIEGDGRSQLPLLLHALINGLHHLTLRALQNDSTRPFRSEIYPFRIDSTIFVWV